MVRRDERTRRKLNGLMVSRDYGEAQRVARQLLAADPSCEEYQMVVRRLAYLVRAGKIFISYRSTDVNVVRPAVEVLLRHDFDVWFAEYEVLSSNFDEFERDLKDSLQAALSACQTAIVFTNDHWADSEYCREEIDFISERLPPERILQVAVPAQHEKPLADWPVLRQVETHVCAGGAVEDLEHLHTWLLGRLGVPPEDRREMMPVPSANGASETINDSYRGGSVGTLMPAPLERQKVPWWHKVTTPADLIGVIRGDPGASFSFWNKAPTGRLNLIIDVRPGRWSGKKSVPELDDDRELYKRLRGMALSGYAMDERLREGGLHLYRAEGRGHLAITFRTPTMFRRYSWKRIYVLVFPEQKGACSVEVNLDFSMRFPERYSTEQTFRQFCAFLPAVDAIAATFEPTRQMRSSPRLVVRLAWALIGSGVFSAAAFVLGRSMPTLEPEPAALLGGIVGAIVGVFWNQRIMGLPSAD